MTVHRERSLVIKPTDALNSNLLVLRPYMFRAAFLPETCRVVIPIKLEFSASVGFIHKGQLIFRIIWFIPVSIILHIPFLCLECSVTQICWFRKNGYPQTRPARPGTVNDRKNDKFSVYRNVKLFAY